MKKIVLFLILMTLISGCGQNEPAGPSVESLLMENEQLLAEVKGLNEKLNEANTVISKVAGEDKEPTFISYIDTSETIKGFNSFDGKIFLPTTLEFPASNQSSGVGYISLVQNIEIYPSQNWSSKISGTNIEMQHSNEIKASLKLASTKESLTADEIKEKVMMPVINSMPANSVKYSTVFLEEFPRGNIATIEAFIDGKEATMKLICINIGEVVILGNSVYLGPKSDVNEEIIETLLRSMKVLNQKLTFN